MKTRCSFLLGNLHRMKEKEKAYFSIFLWIFWKK